MGAALASLRAGTLSPLFRTFLSSAFLPTLQLFRKQCLFLRRDYALSALDISKVGSKEFLRGNDHSIWGRVSCTIRGRCVAVLFLSRALFLDLENATIFCSNLVSRTAHFFSFLQKASSILGMWPRRGSARHTRVYNSIFCRNSWSKNAAASLCFWKQSQRHIQRTFSLCWSMIRRTSSPTVIPRRFASFFRYAICGAVKTMERCIIGMWTSLDVVYLAVKRHP